MARFVIIASFLCLPAAGLAQDMPVGCPPVVVMAKAFSSEGKVGLVLDVPVHVAEERIQRIEKDGIVQEVRTVIYLTKIVQQLAIVDGKKVTVTRRDGKNVDVKDLAKLLEKSTAVVQFRGKVDPYYVQVLRDDVLIVRLPDLEPAPALKLPLEPPPAPK